MTVTMSFTKEQALAVASKAGGTAHPVHPYQLYGEWFVIPAGTAEVRARALFDRSKGAFWSTLSLFETADEVGVELRRLARRLDADASGYRLRGPEWEPVATEGDENRHQRVPA